MKVYYKLEDTEYDDTALSKLATSSITMVLKYWKYRTMWDLRSLEAEIDESGGIIIIEQSGRTHLRGFPRELNDKIIEVLKAADQC